MLIIVLEDFVIILKHNKRDITFDNLICKNINEKLKMQAFSYFTFILVLIPLTNKLSQFKTKLNFQTRIQNCFDKYNYH